MCWFWGVGDGVVDGIVIRISVDGIRLFCGGANGLFDGAFAESHAWGPRAVLLVTLFIILLLRSVKLICWVYQLQACHNAGVASYSSYGLRRTRSSSPTRVQAPCWVLLLTDIYRLSTMDSGCEPLDRYICLCETVALQPFHRGKWAGSSDQ